MSTDPLIRDALAHADRSIRLGRAEADAPTGRGRTTSPVPASPKRYACDYCGHVTRQTTNHHGTTWSFGRTNHCPRCGWKRPADYGGRTTWTCLDAPENEGLEDYPLRGVIRRDIRLAGTGLRLPAGTRVALAEQTNLPEDSEIAWYAVPLYAGLRSTWGTASFPINAEDVETDPCAFDRLERDS